MIGDSGQETFVIPIILTICVLLIVGGLFTYFIVQHENERNDNDGRNDEEK